MKDNMLLQSVCLKCIEHCLQIIGKYQMQENLNELVRRLTDCGLHCIACAQGCMIGTCLPETVEKCRNACDRVLTWNGPDALPGDVDGELEACFAAIAECSAACEA